jgi:hypothetical protein
VKTSRPDNQSYTLISTSQPLAEMPEIDEDDTAVIQYTAGVTAPQSVERSHGNILANVNACSEVMRVTSTSPSCSPAVVQPWVKRCNAPGFNVCAFSDCIPGLKSHGADSIKAGTATLFVGVPSTSRCAGCRARRGGMDIRQECGSAFAEARDT